MKFRDISKNFENLKFRNYLQISKFRTIFAEIYYEIPICNFKQLKKVKNAAKFGFKRIYLNGRGAQPESWHWEYTLRSSKSPTDGQAKHVPETTPDGQKNIYDEQVKKAPTVIGKPKP